MKFVVSDLHGNLNVYNSIIKYLDNLSDFNNNVYLYINGDLIDKGDGSAKMLIDVKNRINYGGKFKIEYLAGNHELMMYKALSNLKDKILPTGGNWLGYNGGNVTLNGLTSLVDFNELEEIVHFISNLNIYHKFRETYDNKNIVLVHAKCPDKILFDCHLKLKDNYAISEYLWAREDDYELFRKNLGNKEYFTIIGHTPVDEKMGCIYDRRMNCLNIDGGSARFVCGLTEYDHVPLIEVDNDNLTILTFNSKDEIISGHHFINYKFVPMYEDELNFKRYLLKK